MRILLPVRTFLLSVCRVACDSASSETVRGAFLSVAALIPISSPLGCQHTTTTHPRTRTANHHWSGRHRIGAWSAGSACLLGWRSSVFGRAFISPASPRRRHPFASATRWRWERRAHRLDARDRSIESVVPSLVAPPPSLSLPLPPPVAPCCASPSGSCSRPRVTSHNPAPSNHSHTPHTHAHQPHSARTGQAHTPPAAPSMRACCTQPPLA